MQIRALPRFVRFALVGCTGFLVDVAALYCGTYFLGFDRYVGRIFSYLSAATATWYLNRLITFEDRRSRNLGREWLKFLAANALGGLINYLVYALFIRFSMHSVFAPAIGVALGSLSGLVVNYYLSRHFVFRLAPISGSGPVD